MQKRIIVAEDDRTQLSFRVLYLERLGFTVAGFLNGKLAFDDFMANGADAILTDGDMPLMDGGELLRAVRTLGRSSVPVFLISVYSQPDFTAWLEKPHSQEQLDQFVLEHLS